jgi:large subunit ribosomal protein L1
MEAKEIASKIKQALEGAPQRKFTESVDMAINLRDLDMSVPGNRINEEVVLPKGRGKKQKVAVIGSGEMVLKAKATADIVIQPDEIEKLADDRRNARKLVRSVEYFIAEAPLMPTIGKRLGVFMGPKGKMPRPMAPGADPTNLIDMLRKTVRVRSRDKATIHVPVGSSSMTPEDIAANVMEILHRVESKTPRGSGNIGSVYIKTTMGPAVKLEL